MRETHGEMSASVLSAFYDMDMVYKDKSININALHINSMLDRKAVGAPLAAPGCFGPALFGRSSVSVDALSNGNTHSLKESASSNGNHTDNRLRERAFSESGERALHRSGSQVNSTRYKTELCRPFEENGSCKYGEKCQFAHGYHELRSLSRHPKYKTEPCRTFHTIGFCPYGPRCHFIHNADERRPAPPANANAQTAEPRGSGPRELQLGYPHRDRDRPRLHHSLSFSGFSSHHGLESPLLGSPTSRTPPPPASAPPSSGFYEDALSPSSGSCTPGSFSFPGQELRALLAPLAVHAPGGYPPGAYFGNAQSGACPSSPPVYNTSPLHALRRLSESPGFEPPPSPPDSLSDRDSYGSGSLSSSGSLSGSESPGLDGGRRLPIFSRLSISDD